MLSPELRPGKGKGPWDGLGATEKTKHLRATFATSEWLMKHTHIKINEIVVFYIDKDEKEDTGFPRISRRWIRSTRRSRTSQSATAS